MIRWHSLYLSSDNQQQITRQLQTIIQEGGYRPYNAFGIMPGIAYPVTMKLFVAPPQNGWTRILVEAVDEDDLEKLVARLSQEAVCVSAWLASDQGAYQVYKNGQIVADMLAALAGYRRETISVEQFAAVLDGQVIVEAGSQPQQAAIKVVSMDDLPSELQFMASNLKAENIEQMFGKLTDRLMGSGEVESASELLKNAPDWSSDAGQRITSLMLCLTLPDNWREPDFPTLRVAYPLYERLARHPNAMRYPGDDEAMQAVPDALDYVPVYGGKDQ